MFEATTQFHSSQTERTPRKLPRAYLALWAGLSCVGAAYIARVSQQSETLPQAAANVQATQAPTEAVRIELKKLRQDAEAFQRELGQLRTDLQERGQHPGVLASVLAIEERMSATTGLPVAQLPTSNVAAVPSPEIAPQPNVAALPTPQPSIELKPIALAPPFLEKLLQPIETGSLQAPTNAPTTTKMGGQLPKAIPGSTLTPVTPVPASPDLAMAPVAPEPDAISFGPAIVKPAPKPYAVQLASGSSLDEMRNSWSQLTDQHAEALGKLSPHVVLSGSDQTLQTFDLIAGPVKTAADAKRICKALAARGTDCKIASFTGDAL